MSNEKLHFFAESAAEICAHSLIVRDRPLRWVVIANPTAGGFTMRSRWKKCRRALDESRAAARVNPAGNDCAPAGVAAAIATGDTELHGGKSLADYGFIPTAGPGSATEITNALIDEINASLDCADKAAPFYLLITAGGDGTSLEALSALYHAPARVRSNAAVLRLPMGTGNDGADAPELAKALDLLIKPSRIEFAPALRLLTAPEGPAANLSKLRGPFLAFNILSTGLDAFVTHMTNKTKGKLPGDFYKLWVDIASLLYDRLYTVGILDVKALDRQGRETCSLHEKMLLVAVGTSGHRTYGSQKKILPDDRNVCAIRQMPLLRKLALKELFSTGTHIDKPESILFNAHRVEFSGFYPILAQMDGETVLLQREDFPAAIELTEPVIPILKKA